MMFATKLLLRYTVKPTSPPRNINPQEITKTFQHEPHIQRYTATCISKSEAKQAIQDANLIKSLRLQRHKLCSRSEPKRVSRRTLSEVEQSIINHPNFEKAAALVQLLGENSSAKKSVPHQIGSMPSGNFHYAAQTDTKTVEAAINIVKDVIRSEKVEKRDENPENLKVDQAVDIKKIEQKKPYVINIYLDTKRNKTLEDVDIKKKIKEFWEENVKEMEKTRKHEATKKKTKEYMINAVSNAAAGRVEKLAQERVVEKVELPKTSKTKAENSMVDKVVEEEKDEEEVTRKVTTRKGRDSQKIVNESVRDNDDSEADTNEAEVSDDRPRYRIAPVQKLYPDTTSKANPHTERLSGGTPRNYDLEERIKEMIAKVTPVNTGGFSKYLAFWKDMWSKKQESKENEEEPSQIEEEQPRQSFRRIENDKVFKGARERRNPYEPKLEEQENHEQNSKEQLKGGEVDDDRETKHKPSCRHQQRNYCTTSDYKRGFSADGKHCGKSKGTTHIHINEFENFNRRNSEDRQKNYFSTLCRPLFRCDANTAGGLGSKVSEKESKTSQTRVDEFVDKLKNAMIREAKANCRKVKVLYDVKRQDSNGQIKVPDGNWSGEEGHRNVQAPGGDKNEERKRNTDARKKNRLAKEKLNNDD